jgi:hypothetical protein
MVSKTTQAGAKLLPLSFRRGGRGVRLHKGEPACRQAGGSGSEMPRIRIAKERSPGFHFG